ncbi:MAG: hemin uptake protein HemP [Alphaproteobacteria bacterium]
MDGADGVVTPNANIYGQNATLAPEATPRRIDVQELLRGQREAILTLQETEYRLRVTSKGKLILTK